MAATGIALLILLALAGWGRASVRALRLPVEDGMESWCLSLGLGFGVLTTLLFWLGIAGELRRPVFWILVVAPAAAAIRMAIASRGRAAATAKREGKWGPAARLLLAMLGVCAAANVMGALAPPSFIDALAYHLYVPQQFLLRRAIVELPAIWQHYQPIAMEMLYMVPLALGSAKAASLLCAGTGILAAAATYLLGARLGGPLTGALAAAIFYANPMVAWESTSCFVDLSVTALGALGMHALLRWNDERRRAWLVTAALLLGFASACKLNAASLAVVGGLLTVIFSVRRGDGVRVTLLRFLGFGALTAVPVVPWLVRSLILTGNPVYPFATNLFGDNPDRAGIEWVFRHYGVGYSLADRILAPWHLFTQGAAFENGNYFSPLPVLMLPVIVWRLREGKGRGPLLMAAAIMLAIWSAGGHVARYVLPISPLLAALAADALCWIGSFAGRRRGMAVTAAGLFLTFGVATTLLYDKQFAPVVFGRESEDAYLRRTTWYYDVFPAVCAKVPPGGRVLTNDQKPTFYLRCPNGRARDRDFADRARLQQLIASGGYTNVLTVAEPDPTRPPAPPPSANLQLVWRRQVDVMTRRTFGQYARHEVALYRVAAP